QVDHFLAACNLTAADQRGSEHIRHPFILGFSFVLCEKFGGLRRFAVLKEGVGKQKVGVQISAFWWAAFGESSDYLRVLAGFIEGESQVLTQARGDLRWGTGQCLAVLFDGFGITAQSCEGGTQIRPGVKAVGRNPQAFFIRFNSSWEIAGLMKSEGALPGSLKILGV